MSGPSPGRTALYRLFDKDGELLYVGIATNPETRWGQHSGDKAWWPQVASRAVEWHDTRAQAAKAEYEAIHAERPAHNQVIPYVSVHADQSPNPVPVDLRHERAIGLSEIGDMLGVSRQRAFAIAKRRDFPAPVYVLARGRGWSQQAVATWAETWDRTNRGGRPPKPKPPAGSP